MEFAALERRLRAALAGPLPGHEAQLYLAPRQRFGWTPGHIPDDHRVAGGLLLLFPKHGEAHLVLTLRSEQLPQHAGQLSLPGGAVEPGESIESAALREAREEVGLDSTRVRLLGRLSPLHIPISGFALFPVVGVTDERPDLRPTDAEVERVLEVPLGQFEERARLKREIRHYRDTRVDMPFFDIEGEKLWGATAMVVSEFLWLLDIRPDPWKE